MRTNDAPLIELVAKHHMLATTALVKEAGLSPSQWRRLLRDDVWVMVVPGHWRHAATPLTWEMKIRAGTAWLGKDAALYGATAARWWGLDGCATDRVEFLVPRGRRHLVPWLTLHTTKQWTKGDVHTRDGVRTSSATRAIIDMARTQSPRTLEAAIDSAVRLRLTSVPTLTKRMRQLGGRGRNGIRTLRTLLLDSGGESFLERKFLRLLRDEELPRPATQVRHRRRDQKVMRVDFEYAEERVVIEVSGRRGHTSDADRRRDARRRNDLQAQGWMVLEFTTADVLEDPPYVVKSVTEALAARARPPQRSTVSSNHDARRRRTMTR
jgi:very-short-patch-repair endonuclease